MVLYCSVACFKRHKERLCSAQECQPNIPPLEDPTNEVVNVAPHENPARSDVDNPPREPPPPAPPLISLTSLKWPYIPEEPAYPDPLKRDDPKALQLHQYEAIATSPAIRGILSENPQLRDILRSIDGQRGRDREDAFEKALRVSRSDQESFHVGGITQSTNREYQDEDVQAMRQLAEAVESAVRGDRLGALGLDWGD